jgi:hypothetical protein
VVGNPLIADASVQAGGLCVTGKGYGVTNVLALDAGNLLMERPSRCAGRDPMWSWSIQGVRARNLQLRAGLRARRITLGDSRSLLRRRAQPDRQPQRTGPGHERQVMPAAARFGGPTAPALHGCEALPVSAALSSIIATIHKHLFANNAQSQADTSAA